jgi:hypothetical protein
MHKTLAERDRLDRRSAATSFAADKLRAEVAAVRIEAATLQERAEVAEAEAEALKAALERVRQEDHRNTLRLIHLEAAAKGSEAAFRSTAEGYQIRLQNDESSSLRLREQLKAALRWLILISQEMDLTREALLAFEMVSDSGKSLWVFGFLIFGEIEYELILVCTLCLLSIRFCKT